MDSAAQNSELRKVVEQQKAIILKLKTENKMHKGRNSI
jgi:hypothetical protein